jgi:hypothetical protein
VWDKINDTKADIQKVESTVQEAKAGIYKDISDAARGVTSEVAGVSRQVEGVGKEVLNNRFATERGLCDLGYEGFGWNVSPFLKVEQVAGICFSHYFVSGVMGRPITSAQALLTKKHVSCIAGHQQGKQIATATRGDGKRITGIITGSCYPGHEEYLGPQGNEHWRGMLMCYEAIDGQFDEGFISLDYLNKRY